MPDERPRTKDPPAKALQRGAYKHDGIFHELVHAQDKSEPQFVYSHLADAPKMMTRNGSQVHLVYTKHHVNIHQPNPSLQLSQVGSMRSLFIALSPLQPVRLPAASG